MKTCLDIYKQDENPFGKIVKPTIETQNNDVGSIAKGKDSPKALLLWGFYVFSFS